MWKSRNGDWFSTLRNKTSNRIIYTIIILEKLAEIYGICKWLIAHCKKKHSRFVGILSKLNLLRKNCFCCGWLPILLHLFIWFAFIWHHSRYLCDVIKRITCFYFHLYRVFFACLFRLIVDMILNLNGKFSARVQILWQKQTVSTRILNDLIV